MRFKLVIGNMVSIVAHKDLIFIICLTCKKIRGMKKGKTKTWGIN